MTIRPLPYTILPLHRYASIMGLNPVHFSQAYDETFFPVRSDCPDVWYKYGWQQVNYVGRHDLAVAIKNAEEDIARVLGYWPAPMWIPAEEHVYPRHFYPEYRDNVGWLPDVTGTHKSVVTRFGKVRDVGRRAVALAGDSVAVSYSDDDGDGFTELATITVDIAGSAAETIMNKAWFNASEACTLGVYFEDGNGRLEQKIRPPLTQSLSGTTLTVTFYSWQLIDPALQDAFPQSDGSPYPIDIGSTDNFVTNVDVYLEYADKTQPSSQFTWEGARTCTTCLGSGCAVCGNNTTNGCLQIKNSDAGVVVPLPASYDDDSETWSASSISGEYEPDRVQVWYVSGGVDRDYEMGYTCDPLDDYLAQTIAWLATARLHENICACGNIHQFAMDLRRDMAIASPEGNFIVVSEEMMRNPFGTRRGEVLAWRRITKILDDRQLSGAAL